MTEEIPSISVISSCTIKNKAIFIDKGDEINHNGFCRFIHFTC